MFYVTFYNTVCVKTTLRWTSWYFLYLSDIIVGGYQLYDCAVPNDLQIEPTVYNPVLKFQ